MKNIDEVFLRIKELFSFLYLTDKQILVKINECMKDVDNNSTNFYGELFDCVSQYYYNFIGNNIDSGDLSDLYCYINDFIKYDRDVNKNLSNMYAFSILLTNIGNFEDRIDKYMEVLSKSKVISKILSNIVNTFGASYPDFIENDSLLILISKYLDYKKIVLENDIEYEYEYDDTEVDYDSYVSDDVTRYLKEISKYSVLSSSEEKDLAIKYFDNHDMMAREKLIKHNLRLCVKPAFKYNGKGVPQMDLIEYANMGLIYAIDRYNPYKGYRISTYAIPWINQKLSSYFNVSLRIIGIPRFMHANLNKYISMKRDASLKYGRDLTLREISKELDMDINKVSLYEQFLQPVVSGNSLIGEDENELFELIPDDNVLDFDSDINKSDLRKTLMSILDNLFEKDKMVIMLRYGLYDGRCYVLEDVALKLYELGMTDNVLTHERIRQIENKVLKRLRSPKNIKKLSDFHEKPKIKENTIKKKN